MLFRSYGDILPGVPLGEAFVQRNKEVKYAHPSAKGFLLLTLEHGKATGELALDEVVFGAEIKPHLVHEVVRAEMNAARAGTRGSKTRGMVSGGGVKPWRQKGTGRARAGTSRSPLWTKGGVVFAPQMRDFSVKVNRKARHAALRAALSDHAQEIGRAHV